MPAYPPAHWYAEAELLPFEPPAPVDTRVGNVSAFLHMLAHAEGTTGFGSQDGYNVIVGGGVFHGYDDHPRQSIHLPRYGISSTAAGRYQFLISTWDDLVRRFGYRDFSPANQDAGAIQLIRQCRALRLVKDDQLKEAIDACSAIWASLPGAGYGQREVAIDELESVYRQAGGRAEDHRG
ncbi:glycoside hydrolase family 24 protein [Halomonas korlensis]|uniref:Muramidase (Phage lambda lysozyme) n=1 Tax=Halomonas korlensis TaxID=463301 RepID=A0A1I7JMH8_9GAMM|nr:glycoside hydrolase family 104 protein [Halomonas korlensis]SFU86366.1 Muramidase (phage lambda lysozyme) [Halomonas korlensis]